MLSITTIIPTNMPNKRLGSFLQLKAAIGAAVIPPTISAKITSQRNFPNPISIRKVEAIATVMKNSARFTEPTALLGSVPVTIKLGIQIGPHPPPPIASINAAKKPSALSLLTGYFLISVVFTFLRRNINL